MNWNHKEKLFASPSQREGEFENNKEKTLFKTYYCLECKQTKPCHLLSSSKCCGCFYKNEQEKAKEYSSYEKVLASKHREKKVRERQLRLLKNYSGCPQHGSKEVDAYSLYSENKLVCQPCLMKKAGGSSSSISFSEQQKWYKRFWKIDLTEWLENYGCLPVNAKCAREWLKDKGHLSVCRCLELEVKKLVELFTGSLQEYQQKLKECSCKKSEKVRVEDDNYTICQQCQNSISVASKKRVIKNRNDPGFWGLNISEKALCLECLQKFQERMPKRKRYLLSEYLKREPKPD